MTNQAKHWLEGAMPVAWFVIAGGGLLLLAAHAGRPGDSGDPGSRWPAASPMRPDATRPTLLIFVHPRCPCSRASLAELARIAARTRGRVTCRAIVYHPRAAGPDWGRSAIANTLAGVPGIRVVPDEAGAEAGRFGVATSGHVLLYSPAGRLLFSGGITPARGHRGDSVGGESLLALTVAGKTESGRCSPVFGCSIAGRASVSGREAIR